MKPQGEGHCRRSVEDSRWKPQRQKSAVGVQAVVSTFTFVVEKRTVTKAVWDAL